MRTAFLLLLALTSVAHAEPEDELAVGAQARALRSRSANALTEHDLVGSQLSYARDLGLRLAPRLSLWAVASLRGGTAQGTLFQTVTTHVDTMELTLGGRASYALHRRVTLHGRLELGSARTRLELTDAMGNRNADSRWGGVGTAAVALDLKLVAMRRFAMGMRVELGYVAMSAPELEARSQEGDDETIMLPVEQVGIGHLDLGGRYFAFAWFGQF